MRKCDYGFFERKRTKDIKSLETRKRYAEKQEMNGISIEIKGQIVYFCLNYL
ncbi:MAG: hypothetical protein WC644_08045 [Ignavibacteria bacterium]